jgi:phosphoribosylanthranilate isomerase
MTWIKICGITNLEDALVAVEAGADALGFVLYEESPRRVKPQQVRAMSERLPHSIEKIGVFVGADSQTILTLAGKAGLSGVQLHAHRANSSKLHPQDLISVDFDCYIGVQASLYRNGSREVESGAIPLPSTPGREQIRGILLDSATPSHPGGTGTTFDWKSSDTAEIVDRIRSAGWNLIVAGGLRPENVTEAMSLLHPWGVDVCSGVESRPGKKDPEKVRAFIQAVREADEANLNYWRLFPSPKNTAPAFLPLNLRRPQTQPLWASAARRSPGHLLRAKKASARNRKSC